MPLVDGEEMTLNNQTRNKISREKTNNNFGFLEDIQRMNYVGLKSRLSKLGHIYKKRFKQLKTNFC